MTLQDFFKANPRAALAFSGGVDSAYLLYAAVRWAERVQPYYVKTPFQPDFEYRDALRLCNDLGVEMRVLRPDVLAHDAVRRNGPDRCYHCKRCIMSTIKAVARADGYDLLLDGSNLSDDAGDRPGMRALEELAVASPLRLCGLTKGEIRRLSKDAGLFTCNKPAYACLATRVRTGEMLTAEKLGRIESAETELMALGYRDFRVRCRGDEALLQFTAADMARAAAQEEDLRARLSDRFAAVRIDTEERKGSL